MSEMAYNGRPQTWLGIESGPGRMGRLVLDRSASPETVFYDTSLGGALGTLSLYSTDREIPWERLLLASKRRTREAGNIVVIASNMSNVDLGAVALGTMLGPDGDELPDHQFHLHPPHFDQNQLLRELEFHLAQVGGVPVPFGSHEEVLGIHADLVRNAVLL